MMPFDDMIASVAILYAADSSAQPEAPVESAPATRPTRPAKSANSK